MKKEIQKQKNIECRIFNGEVTYMSLVDCILGVLNLLYDKKTHLCYYDSRNNKRRYGTK